MPIMNKLAAAYLAGLIDGEGCLDITVQKERYHRARLRISMVDKDLIEWLQKSFGGGFHRRPPGGINKKESYTWSVDGKKMDEILRKIYPYLKVKKRQAEVITLFRKTFQDDDYRRKPNGEWHKMDEAMIEKRQLLYRQLKKLNYRGFAPKETERENPSGMRQSN